MKTLVRKKVVAILGLLPALAFTSFFTPPATASEFVNVGSMATARSEHTATLLQNGQVLVAGGIGDGVSGLAVAELYNPASGVWKATSSLNTGRWAHTATLLPNGKVLVAGGISNETTVASAELYDPVAGRWTVTAAMGTARGEHTATLLQSGKVLVVGGGSSNGIVSTAELYNPASGTWTATGSLNVGRAVHSATLLPNGQVLVAGGADYYGNAYASAELYDPPSGTWTSTNSLSTARLRHTATLLPGGMVLVVGGFYFTNSTITSVAGCELYNPATGTWSDGGSLNTSRYLGSVTLLPSGQILAAGGTSDGITILASAEVYDPTAATWTLTNSLNTARSADTATLLPSGQVLIAGGDGNSGALSSTEIYDPTINPATGSLINTGVSNLAPSDSAATLLPSGQVLVAGGDALPISTNACELYDPATETSSSTGTMIAARAGHRITLLANGTVLAEGGVSGSSEPASLSSAELYNVASGTWTLTGSMNTGRVYHTATLLPSGKVLAAGGLALTTGLDGEYVSVASAEIYDLISGKWSPVASMTTARTDHTATLLPNGKVLVAGGEEYPENAYASAEIYDPVSGNWSTVASMNTARTDHTATLLSNGKVLVAGGRGANNYASAELYDPLTGTWTVTGSMNVARSYHTAALLPNGKVLVIGGGDGEGYSLSTCELYDPVSGTWTVAGSLDTNVFYHTATLLPNGQVLIAGGWPTWYGDPAFAQLFDTGLGYSNAWQPQILSASSPLNVLDGVTLTGSQFRGVSEGSGGNGAQDSSADYPLVQLRSIESGQTMFISPTNWSAGSLASLPISYFPAGYALATVFVNGIPSTSSIVLVPPPPSFQTISNAAGNFTFTWNAVTGFSYQVQYKTNLTSDAWMNLGNSITATNSIMSASDPVLPGAATRFYRIALLP